MHLVVVHPHLPHLLVYMVYDHVSHWGESCDCQGGRGLVGIPLVMQLWRRIALCSLVDWSVQRMPVCVCVYVCVCACACVCVEGRDGRVSEQVQMSLISQPCLYTNKALENLGTCMRLLANRNSSIVGKVSTKWSKYMETSFHIHLTNCIYW